MQLEQTFRACTFTVRSHSDVCIEGFCFFNKLCSRTSVKAVFCSDFYLLLVHVLYPNEFIFCKFVNQI
ncbi:Uncharacterised protein [Vibrio cholerae]|nr:Uncharacterised protein [Vibrio cholerae]